MSTPILKSYVDERGNISVRVSQDVTVLTQEEADRIEAEYKRMQAENAKLRELVRDMRTCIGHACLCDFCPLFVAEEDIDEVRCIADMDSRMRELGVEAS